MSNTPLNILETEPSMPPTRLDQWLAKKNPQISRSYIQNIIRLGGVIVNGIIVIIPHTQIQAGDKILFNPTPIEEKKDFQIPPLPTILYEDDNILGLNKPVGLLVHPAAKTKEPTLIDALKQKYPSISTVGDEPKNRPGIVHRLDRDASGTLLVAKTQSGFDCLKQQFKLRIIKKTYLVIVHGSVINDHDEIIFSISRSSRKGRMAAHPATVDTTNSITRFEVIERKANTSKLLVSTLTGRTHQIRVHFFAYGHPLLGDKIYKSKRYKSVNTRLMLHARTINFNTVEGTNTTIEAPIPSEFN